jgi:luciferase-like monooxygenase
MHSHGPSFLDIRLSKEDQLMALKNGDALAHQFAPQAGWVTFRIEKSDDVATAKKIVQLAYENAKRRMKDMESRHSSGHGQKDTLTSTPS